MGANMGMGTPRPRKNGGNSKGVLNAVPLSGMPPDRVTCVGQFYRSGTLWLMNLETSQRDLGELFGKTQDFNYVLLINTGC